MNIAEATGYYSDVCDIDNVEAFDAWWAENVPDYMVNVTGALIVGTPRPGLHFRFLPTGAGNPTKFIPGCDWRGLRGYALLPPSNHLDGIYEWLNPPEQSSLMAAPLELVKLVRKEVDDEGPPRPVTPLDPARGDATRYGLGALRSACETIARTPDGDRNKTLNYQSYRIHQLVGAGHLVAGLAVDWLIAAGIESGLSEREAARTVKSSAVGQSRPRDPKAGA